MAGRWGLKGGCIHCRLWVSQGPLVAVSSSSSPSAAEPTSGTWHTTWPGVDRDRGFSSCCRKEGGRETEERGGRGREEQSYKFLFYIEPQCYKST